MKTRLILAGFLLVCGLALAAQGESSAPSAKKDAAKVANSRGKPVLEKGMSEEEIVRLIGKPASVEAMAAPQGKAEKWTYRRVVGRNMVQSGINQGMAPAFTGPTMGEELGKVAVLEYRLKSVTTYQVTSLLMFDGKLVVAKQWKEQGESIVD